MGPLELVRLQPLMDFTSGRPEVQIGLVDGPVASDHPDFAVESLREIPGSGGATRPENCSAARQHGTFVAGILSAERGSGAPAICPGCTLLVRPMFTTSMTGGQETPRATPEELAGAMLECIEAGARVLNMSISVAQTSPRDTRKLEDVMAHAARRGVLVVAAAGNEGTIGSSAVTAHPGTIPVVAFNREGRPMELSNLGGAMGRRGLGGPGDGVTSLQARGGMTTSEGTSVAAPFITGAIALLWSAFPAATAADVRFAVAGAHTSRRRSVVPPLLDAWKAYQVMKSM